MSDRKPELYELEYLENSNGTHSVQIIDRVKGRWEALVGYFCFPSHTRGNIRAMRDYSTGNACREVFRQWLEGGDELLSPKDWNNVIKVLRLIGNLSLAEELLSILTEPNADSKATTMETHPNVSLYSRYTVIYTIYMYCKMYNIEWKAKSIVEP